MKQATALAALAVLGSALAAPAFAGPYVSGKAAAKGTNEDYKKVETELKVGYDTKIGALKPYIEVGPGWELKDGAKEATFSKLVEVGSKIKITDDLGAKVKAEYAFDNNNDVDWKYEVSASYSF
jgi:ribosomal protein L7/L12